MEKSQYIPEVISQTNIRYVYYGIEFTCAAQVKKWIIAGHIVKNGFNNPQIRIKTKLWSPVAMELNYTNAVAIAPNVYEFESVPPRRVFKNYTLMVRIPYNKNFAVYSQENNGPVNYAVANNVISEIDGNPNDYPLVSVVLGKLIIIS